MNNSDFLTKATQIINKITEIIENNDPHGLVDVDLNDGILTIVNDNGTYVINKQSAAQEIWLSSPVSGPYHFALINDKWSSRKGFELLKVLRQELNIEINE